MARLLKVLLVEDNAADAELIVRELRRAGFDPQVRCVDNEADYLRELDAGPDVVLADYQLPRFSGPRALALTRARASELPFILVSGTLGEETAVLAIKEGASDFLLKDRLGRLGAAVAQALESSRLRVERARAEERLRLQETALETAGNAIIITDGRGVIEWVNPAFTRQSGYRADEAIGQTPRLLKSGRHDRDFYRKLWETLLAGKTWRGCFTNRRKDGSLYYAEHTITPVAAQRGAVTHFVAILNDVTERRNAEEALQESEERYRLMVEEAPDAVFALRPDRSIAELNPAFEAMTGHRREDWVGRDFAPLIEPESLPAALQMFQRCLRGERTPLFELRIRRKSGGFVEVEFAVVPRMRGQEVVAITGMGRDVAARKQAEAALRASEERFRELAENIQEVFWVTDPARNQTVYISPAYEKIWGRTCQSLLDSPNGWSDALHPDDRAAVQHASRTAQTPGTYHAEYRILRPDGAERWIRDRAFPVHREDGTVKHIVGVAEDITERRRMEEQLRQAQKMEAIGTLAGGIAHDFNNILAAIMLHLDLLELDARVSPAMKASLSEVSEAARRAAHLTRQLLLFSRREAVRTQPVDLNGLVGNLFKMLDRLVGENFTLLHIGERRPLWIHADPGMIDVVVINLVVNARDAMPRGGRIVVQVDAVEAAAVRAPRPVESAAGFVRLRVTDTGCGMSPDTQARIFEPFFTTKAVGKGTGLGLSTAFGIVEQHAGWIEVESEEGKGSSFHVYLPAHPGGGRAERPEPKPAVEPRRAGESILVAEDNDAIRRATAGILRQHGYRVLEAADGRTAQRILDEQAEQLDLVLTDNVMPGGIMGQELAATLRASARRPKLILMSGQPIYPESGEVPSAVNAFLAKPFDANRLLRVVRATLDGVAPPA